MQIHARIDCPREIAAGDVQTHTTYGSDSATTWGAASSVVEDYGDASHANRTTHNEHYNPWGKPDVVVDAAGQQFNTAYDQDGQVLSVSKGAGANPDPIVSYIYGPTPGTLEYGQVTSVTDHLSGVVNSIQYTQSGGGLGQPYIVTETNGTDSYTVTYGYNDAGDRSSTEYLTPTTHSKYAYLDYVASGAGERASRAFQTMIKLGPDGSGDLTLPTSEEFDYLYDTDGRLLAATFAQTPTGTDTDYSSHGPSSFAQTQYVYDAAGRTRSVATRWTDNSGGTPTVQPILGNNCTYELTGVSLGLARGLKTSSNTLVPNTGPTDWPRSTQPSSAERRHRCDAIRA